jgi:hypothetical protein
LGLAIAHDLVIAQGGDIRVASELGHGTVFSIRFPAVADREASASGSIGISQPPGVFQREPGSTVFGQSGDSG